MLAHPTHLLHHLLFAFLQPNNTSLQTHVDHFMWGSYFGVDICCFHIWSVVITLVTSAWLYSKHMLPHI